METDDCFCLGRWQCATCWTVLASRRLLREHQVLVHGASADTPALRVCDVCGKAVRKLAQHRRAHFESERRFTCNQCGFNFLYKSVLRAHVMTHLDTACFQCEVCADTFSHAANLRAHMRRIHLQLPVQRRHECTLCGKRFRAPNELRRHSTTHTGEKAFRCEVCGSAYQRSHHLVMHRMRKHQLMPYPCAMCPAAFQYVKQLAAHAFEQHQMHLLDRTRPRISIDDH